MPKDSKQLAAPAAPQPTKLAPHELLLSSPCQNGIAAVAWGGFAGKCDISTTIEGLLAEIDKIKGGDLSSIEAMLYAQALALQTIFTSMALQASTETGFKLYTAKLTFALKAQAQCRTTLEALAEIKNPRPVQFVKQANMSNGPQQVNNTYAPQAAINGAGNIESEQSKLLEADHHGYLDTSTQGATVRAKSHLATVERLHGADVASGQAAR